MRKRLVIAALGVYGLVAIVSFGHCAASVSRDEAREYAECERTKAKDGYCFRDLVTAPLSGGMAAVLWPLYWSWVAFEPATPIEGADQ